MTATRRRRRVLITLATALVVVLAACGSSDDKSSEPTASGSTDTTEASGSTVDYSNLSGTLNGSGSTFQAAFEEIAIAGFQEAAPDVTVNYAGGGSGKGKQDLADQVVDFAGTDSVAKPETLSTFKGGALLYFPIASAPITISFNVPGVDELNLSPDTLAKIFSRTITKWDDDAIAAENDGADLPSDDIVVAHRADGSGTTSNFTKYLDAAAPDSWTLGSGDTVDWDPNTQAGTGNPGVADIVKTTDFAIGYVDFADANAAGLSLASIKNSAGKYVAPSLEGAAAAVESAEIADDLTYSPLNASGADAYPITSPTWILVYETQSDKEKGAALKGYLNYVLTDGQDVAEDADFAKLPDSLRDQAIAQLDKIVLPGS